MHTAFDVKKEMFSVEIHGQPATREDLLNWDMRDRLGVVVSEPLGALNAGLLILLVATAFYDANKQRRRRTLYPDIFLFHSGGRWGSHLAFDFAPDHKEVFVDDDPRELLRAINNRGITHLVIPDRSAIPVKHRFKEPESAMDRLKLCLVYGAGGHAVNADVAVSVPDYRPLVATYEGAVYPEAFLASMETMIKPAASAVVDNDELALVLPLLRARLPEVSTGNAAYSRIAARHVAAKAANTLTDHYRRVDVADALEMLHFVPLP